MFKTISRKLADAETKIAKYGHLKGDYGNDKKGYCINGAIGEWSSAIAPAEDFLRDFVSASGLGIGAVVVYNDAPETTAQDARDLLLDAASCALSEAYA